MIYIGIDPGVKTGYAMWDAKDQRFLKMGHGHILKIMDYILFHHCEYTCQVIIEDARKRKKFDRNDWDPKKYQGVGSVKRDCQLWEDFCRMNNINYVMKHPRNTKYTAETFRKLTNYEGRTNEHERDAAMLVFGMK